MKESAPQSNEALLVVLDGGAFLGAVQPGLVSYLEEHKVNVGAYAGISIGSWMSTLVCNGKSQEELREFMLKHFLRSVTRALIPPWRDPLRMLAGGLFDHLPLTQQLVKELDLKPQPNLRIVSFDLLSMKPFVFQGTDYPLDVALAASCSPYPVLRPVRYVDEDGKQRMLVDACAYLLHKRIFNEPTLIARMFPIKFRKSEVDETEVMVGYPFGKIVRRVTPAEYDKYRLYGYKRAAATLKPLLNEGKLPLRDKSV
ncbi:MAG TPA: patatin-like phospholipase family protein [Candidatus Melainabacteria bacterium]|nr:patatin-like phospholipase family protein [Candidatus Melainabacteria bacterium]